MPTPLLRAWHRVRSPTSTNERILRALVVTGGLSGAAKIIAIGKEALIARQFGRADIIDCFFIAFALTDFLNNLISGTFAVACIPTLVEIRATEPEAAQSRAISSILTASLVVLLGSCATLAIAGPSTLGVLASGFGAQKLHAAYMCLLSLIPYFFASAASAMLAAVLNAEDCFAQVAAAAALPALGAIGALLLFPQLSAYALSLGLGLGASIQLTWMGVALHARLRGVQLRWFGFDRRMRIIARECMPAIASTILAGAALIVDQAMAAMLPAGSVAALTYGNRIVSGLLAVGGLSLASGALPYFSRMCAQRDWSGCRHTLKTFLFLIGLASLPLVAAIWLLSEPLVRILYQRGAFSGADTLLVARVQDAFALQIPFYLGTYLIIRLLAALRANRVLFWSAAIQLPVDIGLNFLFMRTWGVAGIAMSTSIVYAVTFFFVGWCSLRLVGQNERELAVGAEAT